MAYHQGGDGDRTPSQQSEHRRWPLSDQITKTNIVVPEGNDGTHTLTSSCLAKLTLKGILSCTSSALRTSCLQGCSSPNLIFGVLHSVGGAMLDPTGLALYSVCWMLPFPFSFVSDPLIYPFHAQPRIQCAGHLRSAPWSNYTGRANWCLDTSPGNAQNWLVSSFLFLNLNSFHFVL
jgi:hypothetical protein